MVNKKTVHAAVRSGNVTTVETQLTRGADIGSQSYENDKSALHIAVEINNIEIVEFLLNRGAKVDLKDSFGRTPLMYALPRGQLDIADVLIKAGGAVNARDKCGCTALMRIPLEEKINQEIGYAQLTTEILARGVNINSRNSNGHSALMEAALYENLEMVRCLVEAGADIRCETAECVTALGLAVEKRNLEMVQCLLSHDAEVNFKNLKGESLLHVAIQRNDSNVANCLIDAGIDLNCRDIGKGYTALHLLASKTNHLYLVGKILSKNVDIHLKDHAGISALGHALGYGNLEVADLLIDAGGNVNDQDNQGYTVLNLICNPHNRKYITDGLQLAQELVTRHVDPSIPNKFRLNALHSALCHKELNIARYLADVVTNIDYQDNEGDTALNYAAVISTTPELVDYLLARNASLTVINKVGKSVLHVAIDAGNLVVADYLIDAGVDFHYPEPKDGWTALHMLSLHSSADNVSLVQKLLSRGADVHFRDNSGFTALSYALARGHLVMADILINAGANVNSQSNEGDTALHLITDITRRLFIKDSVTLTKALLTRNVGMNVQNSKGQTALHLAFTHGELEMAKYLINEGADVNLQDENGNTALHSAASCANVLLISFLLTKCADINVQNNEANTALHIATILKKTKMIGLLLFQGADKSIRNNVGKTAFETAIIESNGRFLTDHFVAVELPDATFTRRYLIASHETPQFQNLKSLADVKDLKSPDPIHFIETLNVNYLAQKVSNMSLKKKGKATDKKENEPRDVKLFDFELFQDDKLFKLFFEG